MPTTNTNALVITYIRWLGEGEGEGKEGEEGEIDYDDEFVIEGEVEHPEEEKNIYENGFDIHDLFLIIFEEDGNFIDVLATSWLYVNEKKKPLTQSCLLVYAF